MGRGQEFFVADFWSKAEKMRYKDTSWPKLLSTFFNKFKQISPNNNITSNDKKIIVGKTILLIVFSDYYLYLWFTIKWKHLGAGLFKGCPFSFYLSLEIRINNALYFLPGSSLVNHTMAPDYFFIINPLYGFFGVVDEL